ncbi:DNA polymerase zeta processivity subunit [Echria macrotheca]|uniref:DNA polymerase zeta processivity subunit n=1 Tax=Echria macrotheca TaxID=438768 RepID=A0AAJ0BF06_9PEZI|nr:DNA polymerase zeta processivity subunit [Echria macrotheca]
MASLSLDQSHTLLNSFNSFLTVAIHNILYYRAVYPPQTFLSTRAYNLPVHQNRHPRVCTWIRDAVDAVAVQLAGGTVSRIAIVIHSPLHQSIPLTSRSPSLSPSPSPSPLLSSPTPSSSREPKKEIQPGTVLERWLIDVSSFPSWPDKSPSNPNHPHHPLSRLQPPAASRAKAMRDHGKMLARESRDEESRDRNLDTDEIAWADVDEQFRGALRRMAHAAEGMVSLPEGCSFTLAVELRDEVEGAAPIGHPQAWIPSEPKLQPRSKSKSVPGEDIGGSRTTPIRSVEAGPLFFECWVEESKAKEAWKSFHSETKETG